MAQKSLLATSRDLMIGWRTLDDIVEHFVRDYLDNMNLSEIRRIRVDETSAKKHHKYLTIVTDVDSGAIIFYTKGKGSEVIKEFAAWLSSHNGNPDNIELVSSDFGKAFIAGTRQFLKNAETVADPFHLIQIANRHMDHDRARCQVNGERKKSLRFSFLKGKEKLDEKETKELMDFTKDHEEVARSYQMKESLRDVFSYSKEEIAVARAHLVKWIKWASDTGSKGFKALAKTVTDNLEAILRSIETGINNGYQESLNGRVQLNKAIARGYKDPLRLGRISVFRQLFNEY